MAVDASNSARAPRKLKDTRYNVFKLLLIGLVFHLVYIGSVFDCYFTSPVVSGMKSYHVGTAEAKRLVLIVGDGLRADLLFSVNPFPNIVDSPQIVAPHLRSIVENRGAFGISHTRVPTESRPGHVAIIGGMYEDVSAVTKGWKTNPVDFDSVFNQSSTTFSFGSPDILPMFARGATPGKVKTWSYNEEDEDFTKDATTLDIWVLDQLQTLFKNATSDPTLDAQLRSGKVVFFLHLLGLDTTGHSYRPHSKEYMKNIQVVDDIVRDAEQLISEYYQDQETSFIFTADHGMSVIGNHGDGHPDNTRTPLIAWGKGVRGPLPDTVPTSHDAYSEPWRLNHLFRRDVEQADIASLMAALIGISWPVNSVGVLPDVNPTLPGYLNPQEGDEARAKVALVNAKVILEHYRMKHELKQRHTLFYQPFKPLEGSHGTEQAARLVHVSMIERLISNGEWHSARQESLNLIQQALLGLHYLQTYDRLLIRIIVTLAYTGWAAYASIYILRPPPAPKSPFKSYVTLISAIVLLGSWTFFAIQRSPLTFYIYIVFPCYFWRQFLFQAFPLMKSRLKSRGSQIKYGSLLFLTLSVILVLQGMVAAYTHRSIWSVGFILVGLIWPFAWEDRTRYENWGWRFVWGAVCVITGIFPLLSVDKRESLVSILLGGASILFIGGRGVIYVLDRTDDLATRKSFRTLFSIQALLILATMLITASSVVNLQEKRGLPILNQLSGWTILVASSILPFTSRGKHHTTASKLVMFFLGFGPCFVILSISIEGLFYVAYSATLVTWIKVEQLVRIGPGSPPSSDVDKTEVNKGHTPQDIAYRFQPDDLRVALFFLFFVQVGFFGIGNVASISSFYLEPVYRLIPIFSPFFMASLLIFKIVAPYVILALAFALLNQALHLPPFSLLLVAFTLMDGMTLAFFFNVRDTGSWLEIGQSISFFCITSLLLLWSAGICAAGEYLIADLILTKPSI